MRKIFEKMTAFIILSTIVMNLFVLGNNKEIQEMSFQSDGGIEMIEELRTENSDTYLLPDGTYDCVIYSDKKYYKDEYGHYKVINNEIVNSKYQFNDKNYMLCNDSNSFKTYFAEKCPEVLLSKDNKELSFGLIDANQNGSTIEKENRYGFDFPDLSGKNTVTYPDALDGTDIIYSVKNGALKEYMIIKEKSRCSFEFEFDLGFFELKQVDSNRIEIYNGSQLYYEIGNMFAVDSMGVYTDKIKIRLDEKKNNKCRLHIDIDPEYLNDTNRVFPVLVDPTIMITSESNTYDTYVSSKYPTNNYSSTYYLRTGKDTDYYVRRSFIKFSIPSSVMSGIINSAEFRIKRGSGSVPNAKLYMITSSWSPNSVTWNSQPNYTGANSASLVLDSNDWYNANVTEMVRKWAYGDSNNYGFAIKDQTEDNVYQWTTFLSSEASSPNKPELHINYTQYKRARLIGVTASGHDHSTCLTNAKTFLNYCNFSNVYIHTGEFSLSTIQNLLDTGSNGFFLNRSHGGLVVNSSNVQIGTYFSLDDNGTSSVLFYSSSSMNSLNLSNMKLILFISCHSGKGGEGGPNLPSVAVNKGAKTAVGFESTINCSLANSWTVDFANKMKDNKSVAQACFELAALSKYTNSGLTQSVVCGTKTTKLK